MGAVSNFSKLAFDCLMQARRAECFTLVAECQEEGCDAIIGEASYAFDCGNRCGEFAISVADRWQRQGLGSALLSAVQLRAVSLGYLDLFGETLKTNEEMKNLARKAGFACTRSLDWRAYARTDRDYIKLFRKETDMRCHVLLDTSRSMAFRGVPDSEVVTVFGNESTASITRAALSGVR